MKKILLSLLMLCILLCGCEQKSASVSVTCYPLQYLVERIGGSVVNVNCISNNEFIQRASIKENYLDIVKESDALRLLTIIKKLGAGLLSVKAME